MIFIQIIAALSLFAQYCLAASIDLWTGPERSIDPRDEVFKPIDPKEIIARLGTTPQQYEPEERHWGMVSDYGLDLSRYVTSNHVIGILL